MNYRIVINALQPLTGIQPTRPEILLTTAHTVNIRSSALTVLLHESTCICKSK